MIDFNKQQVEQWLKDAVSSAFMDLLYYDRKEDEDMNQNQLRELMDNGTLPKETFVKVFMEQIDKEYS